MSRKTLLSIPAVLIGVIVVGIMGMILWIVLIIPFLVRPSLVPDPRATIGNFVTRQAIKSMMKGAPSGRKAA